jgi:superfamily I DNA/RNA helicase
MANLDKIKQYLSKHPFSKAKEIARSMGYTRKAVNSILYYNSDIFQKNEANCWDLEAAAKSISANLPPEVSFPKHQVENTIVVEDIDLVERIKELLKKHTSLKTRDVAEQLDESRSLVNRTLHSFQAIFDKNDNNEWQIKSGYLDNTTGPDADFKNLDCKEDSVVQLPITDFREENKPPQQAVIEATLDRNFLVLAPPGTGKTYTLIERLVYAITKTYRDVDAGELLVLSFTRAAVGEIRERIARAIASGAPSSLRYVRVRTFDAYATWLLQDGDYDIAGKNYDARIKLLIRELQTLELRQETARLDRSRYLFVDEIQDLVGLRAEMVFELVKRILANKGSVTLLGDPHQSLNDWQITENQTDSTEFLEKVQNHLVDGLESFELEKFYRYETEEMNSLALEAKKTLDNGRLGPADKLKQLVQLIPEITQEQLIKSFKAGSVDALLCRSNGEVYQWFKWHNDQGNSCSVNSGAIGRPWPAWIGQAIMHYQSIVITRDKLLSRLSSNVNYELVPSGEDLDEFLLNERLIRRNVINLDDLAFRLKNFSPENKGNHEKDGLIISTVHKAKGLEFKNVVAIKPSQKKVTDEEVRVLYVAITRARSSIYLLPKKEIPFSSRMAKNKKSGHLRYMENGIKFLQVKGLEDFDLDTLFINEQGGVDDANLENYLLTYQEDNHYLIHPESCNSENDHNYALYLISQLGQVRICAVSEKMKKSLDAMAYGNDFGEDGAMLDMGSGCSYQTIVHPMESAILARHIGPAKIMVFPLIQGFYQLSRAQEFKV